MGAVKSFLYKRFERYATWPTWRLLVTGCILLAVFTGFMRYNNQHAKTLYDRVMAADESGGDIKRALGDLQVFTASHMNASINQRVQLVQTYNRDAKKIIDAAQAKLQATQTIGADLYTKAQQACEAPNTYYSIIAQCIADYVLKNNPGISVEQLSISLPDPALYTSRFISPGFSFDGAGISLLLALLCFVGALFRVWLGYIFRKIWRKREQKYYLGG